MVLLLYSKEITNIFKQKKLNLTNTNVRENQTESNESIELMGSVRYASSQKMFHVKKKLKRKV